MLTGMADPTNERPLVDSKTNPKWDDPGVRGIRTLDRKLSKARNVDKGLATSEKKYRATIQRGTGNTATMNKATQGLSRLDLYRKDEVIVPNQGLQVDDIAARYAGRMQTSAAQASLEDKPIPGTGWYFDSRREGDKLLADSGVDMAAFTPRQRFAASARVSNQKKPEMERSSVSGSARLVSSPDATINGKSVASLSSQRLGQLASSARTHVSTKGAEGGAAHFGTDDATFSALADAGHGHAKGARDSIAILRGEVEPREAFSGDSPKTAPYAENHVLAEPGSMAEVDYRNISSHYRDVVGGKQHEGQGMLMFSSEKPGDRAPILRPDNTNAIDTWMLAAGSGQKMVHSPSPGGRNISPAKQLTDKGMPLDPSSIKKSSVAPRGYPHSPSQLVAAQHNEAIRRASVDVIGAVSHDQHGQDVFLPSTFIQESVWTHARDEGKQRRHPIKSQSRALARSDQDTLPGL